MSITRLSKAVEFLTINNSNILKEKIVSLEEKQNDIALMKLEHQRELKSVRDEVREEVKLQIKQLISRLKPEIVGEAFS